MQGVCRLVRDARRLGRLAHASFLDVSCVCTTERPYAATSPQKELKEVERDKLSGVTVKVKGGNLQRLIGTLEGML